MDSEKASGWFFQILKKFYFMPVKLSNISIKQVETRKPCYI